jgi:hypothetical protein
MQCRRDRDSQIRASGIATFLAHLRFRSVAIMAGLAALAGVVQPRLQSQMNSDHPYAMPPAVVIRVSEEPLGKPAKQALREANRRINLDRQKQMTEDSAKLLQLATDLRAEVSTDNQRAMSAETIRKAEQIAKLAHNVHEKMKLRFSD